MAFSLGSHAGAELGLPIKHWSQADMALIELGKTLFFDRRLSVNSTLSCAMCHIPEQGFAQNQLATPVGLEGRAVKRNSPTLLNVAFQKTLFHDGREFTLENQVWSPLLSAREMGNRSIGLVIERIQSIENYQEMFALTLGQIDVLTIGQALAAYERTLLAGDSPFDRWFYGGDKDAVSSEVIEGYALFNRHGCSACHLIDKHQAMLTDHLFHNTGIGFTRSMSPKAGTQVIQLTDTIMIETEEQFEGEVFNDLGRYEVTGLSDDRWRFRTPSLRNVALTRPYMHDGSMASLEDVIRYYMQGGFNTPNQDKRIMPFSLTDKEVHHLVTFLVSLTSSHIGELVTSARQAPIGDN